MRNPNGRIVNNSNHAHSLNSQRTGRAGIMRALSQLSWWNFTNKAVAVAVGVVAVAIAFSFVVTPPAEAQLGSPPFANPGEVRYRADEKRLRAIMELIDGEFSVPNGKTEQYRQYRGWDAAMPRPSPGTSVSPGPTLRARLGDQVQIAFLNKIDESKFPYTFVTDSTPGFSDFGCDKVGLRDPQTNKYPYPANDKFPNCFHGSSTANIHFHGTHTNPDGLGDNVLVQVLPDPMQPDWTATFDQLFNSGQIPQKWNDLPVAFRDAQKIMVQKHDAKAAADAIKNGLRPPDPLWPKNEKLIAAGLWPEYFIGAFPNFFEIPDYSSGKFKAGQAPGTHWYHAHKHGSTSLHIRNGLAGALIIESNQEGGYDHFIRKFYEWGDTYGEHEKIFIFQQYDPTQNLERMPRQPGTRGNQVLVNGQLTPTITMRPGEVQLWRFINATQGNLNGGIIDGGTIANGLFQTLSSGFTFVQTAQDGAQFSPTNYANQPFLNGRVPDGFKLAAGNRADLLVKAPQTTGITPFKSAGATLFFVDVTGDPVTPEKFFPNTWAEMPRFLLDLPKPGPNDIPNPNSPVKFQWEERRTGPGPSPDPPRFMINGKQFFETGPIVDQCMPQDGLQEWVLENYTTVIAHPFHIHINPFQVIRIDTPTAPNTYSTYAPKDNFVWQDVIAIPPAIIVGTQITPGRVMIRQTYPDFTGTFVLHCHILAHEDRGMMQLVRIVPLANYPQACQGHTPDHH